MTLRHWLGSTAVVAATALAAVAGAPGASAASSTKYPVPYNFAAGIAAQTTNPGSSPPGSNIPCTPSKEHPHPVVLVHGTFGDMTDSWQALSPLLANHGYCVFALNYGGSPGNPIQAYGDIPTSAQQLGDFVTQVLQATGASKVDIVGHSQGGMMPRYYIKFLGGASYVHTLVGLAPSNHGTTEFGLTKLAAAFPGGSQQQNTYCPACSQQQAGSPFLQHLNGTRDPVPPTYTVIETKYDEVVTPYQSTFLPRATNIVLQHRCPQDLSDHLSIIYDKNALMQVLKALDPDFRLPPCVVALPVLGGGT